eukprot:CAMPEP_0170291710 /NCGR_PEP_ID=MMETSP0116_2-20130129/45948_1 /TAXON_ID=400756 /ORGANISM="Durinskia baltica, Strain CSIRO CS-38" /LENGTH=1013 /DNA_ID=CAMNT_0010543199 /DNA_START=29 /DNA_END=3070 /DNA_ORIENTATION=+
MSNMDEDCESVLGEVDVSPQLATAAKTLEVIWDDDKIERYIDNEGKRQWKCLWCGRSFQHWNATKALLHVTKQTGGDVRKCSCNSIDRIHQQAYQLLLNKQTTKKNSQQLVRESKKQSSDEYIAGAGQAYSATQRKKTTPPNISASSTPSPGISGSQKQMTLTFGLETPNSTQQNSEITRYHQTKLGDHSDPQSESQLTMAIADLIHSCGLPFSLAIHHKFQRVLTLAKVASTKYVPPGRNKVAGELLDLNYQIYKKKMIENVVKDANVYGLTFFGDGATVKKLPLINILVSSVYLPVGCLAIVDCSGHLQADGKKDAAYISELFIPHITELETAVPSCTDLVIFDGASNVQKAGLLLEAKFPHLSVIHGAEHVISLFYSDVFHLREFKLLKTTNRLIYRYFGSGAMHSPYAIFSKHTKDHNSGRSIGLIRASDTRMGGHVISMLRTLRLKDSLISTISSASFLQGKFKIDKKIIDLLKLDTTWEYMAKFVRAVFPMLIVLRLADQKDPVMDKLYFYVRRMDKTLEISKVLLDELAECSLGQSWRFLNSISDDGVSFNDQDSVNSSHDHSDSSTDDSDNSTISASLGQKVVNIWKKRREKLVSDFAIAGWLLSPIPDVFEDSSSNMDGEHRLAVDRLLKKMMGAGLADDSDELASIMNTFWFEYEQFKSKSGPFDRAYIWNPNNQDLILGTRSHLWHKTNSYFHTKVFGKFACRVCSKIVGMGSAERNWSAVKHLKTEKRAHLSPEAVQKQATIFGASCMADAALERLKAQSLTSEPYKFWDEKDFDSQFDLFAAKEPIKKPPRFLKCYFEDWEQEHVKKKDDVSEAKFLHKYGGLEFQDIDNGRLLKIDDTEMWFTRKKWCVSAVPVDGEAEPWWLGSECPLYDCLAMYYSKHPEKNVKVVLRKNQATDGPFLVNVSHETEKEQTTSPKKTSPKKRKHLSPNKIRKMPPAPKRLNTSDDLSPCGGCGAQVGPVHKCDKCGCHMHPFCGRTIGEEGYGSSVRCKECDSKSSVS